MASDIGPIILHRHHPAQTAAEAPPAESLREEPAKPVTPKPESPKTESPRTAEQHKPAAPAPAPSEAQKTEDKLHPFQKYLPHISLQFLGDLLTPKTPGNDSNQNKPPELSAEEKAIQNYLSAKENYKKNLDKYWSHVEEMKDRGMKITDFPALYDGPARPKGFTEPQGEKGLPTVNTMLRLSKSLGRIADHDSRIPDFTIKDVDELTFKNNYVKEALHLAKEFSLSPEQMQLIVEKVYKFECGGRAYHDTLSGVPYKYAQPDEPGQSTNLDARRSHRAISTGLGFNQLLTATSMHHLQHDGKVIADRLRELSKDSDRPAELNEKARIVENLQQLLDKELASFAQKAGKRHKAYYDNDGKPLYSLFQDFGKSQATTSVGLTGRQMATALQSLNLDGDIGPIIQSRQVAEVLTESLKPATNASLQNKLDRDAERARQSDDLSPELKQRAINELFAIAGHAKRNPAAASLKEKIEDMPQGLSKSLSADKLTVGEYNYLNDYLLEVKKAGGRGGAISEPARKMLAKIQAAHFGERTVDSIRPAYVELANLAGKESATGMVKPENLDASTVNFFSRQGYHVNKVVQRRSASELIDAIYRRMERTNFKNTAADASAGGDNAVQPPPGIQDFNNLFTSAFGRGK